MKPSPLTPPMTELHQHSSHSSSPAFLSIPTLTLSHLTRVTSLSSSSTITSLPTLVPTLPNLYHITSTHTSPLQSARHQLPTWFSTNSNAAPPLKNGNQWLSITTVSHLSSLHSSYPYTHVHHISQQHSDWYFLHIIILTHSPSTNPSLCPNHYLLPTHYRYPSLSQHCSINKNQEVIWYLHAHWWDMRLELVG